MIIINLLRTVPQAIKARLSTALIFSVLVFAFNTDGPWWSNHDWFTSFQKDSESLVLGFLLRDSEQDSRSLALLRTLNGPESDRVTRTYAAYADDSSVFNSKDFYIYSGQPSLIGLLYAFPNVILRDVFLLNGQLRLATLRLLSSMGTAAVVMFIGTKVGDDIGRIWQFVVYAICLASPWFVAHARNLYWSPFLFLLPILVSFHAFPAAPDSRGNKTRRILLTLLFLAFTAKMCTGLPYIVTLWIIVATIALVGDLPRRIHAPKDSYLVQTLFIIFVSTIFYIIIHVLSNYWYFNSTITEEISNLVARTAGRTHAELPRLDSKETFDRNAYGLWWDSHAVDFIETIKLYIDSEIIIAVMPSIGLRIIDTTAITFGICIINIILFNTNKRVLSRVIANEFRDALIIGFSLIGSPIAWIIAAKSWSYIHTHIGFVSWSISLIALGPYFAKYTLRFGVNLIGYLYIGLIILVGLIWLMLRLLVISDVFLIFLIIIGILGLFTAWLRDNLTELSLGARGRLLFFIITLVGFVNIFSNLLREVPASRQDFFNDKKYYMIHAGSATLYWSVSPIIKYQCDDITMWSHLQQLAQAEVSYIYKSRVESRYIDVRHSRLFFDYIIDSLIRRTWRVRCSLHLGENKDYDEHMPNRLVLKVWDDHGTPNITGIFDLEKMRLLNYYSGDVWRVAT